MQSDLRAAQIQAVNDPKKKFTIAHALVKAKIERSLQVLDWLAQRYDIEHDVQVTKREAAKLGSAHTVAQLRTVEGRVALRYWEALRKALPEWLDFQGRMTSSHQNNASDPFNAALNYGYGFLEGECRMAIHAVGLEPAVGFLHDFSNYQTKQSLVFDLQEPFRWLVDLSVLQAFESRTLQLHDFYFTGDDYRYRFEPEAKHRFIETLCRQFNLGINHKCRTFKWGTAIKEKTKELGRFLTGKISGLSFENPAPNLSRQDSRELRSTILSLTPAEATRLGIAKQTLHDLRVKSRSSRSFKLYTGTRSKLSEVMHSPI